MPETEIDQGANDRNSTLTHSPQPSPFASQSTLTSLPTPLAPSIRELPANLKEILIQHISQRTRIMPNPALRLPLDQPLHDPDQSCL